LLIAIILHLHNQLPAFNSAAAMGDNSRHIKSFPNHLDSKLNLNQ